MQTSELGCDLQAKCAFSCWLQMSIRTSHDLSEEQGMITTIACQTPGLRPAHCPTPPGLEARIKHGHFCLFQMYVSIPGQLDFYFGPVIRLIKHIWPSMDEKFAATQLQCSIAVFLREIRKQPL